jgi:Dihaem cytochrome c
MRLIFATAFLSIGMTAALADGDRMAIVTDDATKAECSACHMAFPAGLLPARSWEAIMKELPNHFGEDASLAPALASAITAYLVANANDAGGKQRGFARRVAADQVPLRITELPGFMREHGSFPDSTMARVGKMSNCVGCHQGAEKGIFEDD